MTRSSVLQGRRVVTAVLLAAIAGVAGTAAVAAQGAAGGDAAELDRALGDDRSWLLMEQGRMAMDRGDLGEALRPAFPNDPLWDYGIGKRTRGNQERVFWVEIHPASSEHVQEVLHKLAWLHAWLRGAAPRLDLMEREFVWVASGKVRLPPNAPKRRLVAARGVRFVGERLEL